MSSLEFYTKLNFQDTGPLKYEAGSAQHEPALHPAQPGLAPLLCDGRAGDQGKDWEEYLLPASLPQKEAGHRLLYQLQD